MNNTTTPRGTHQSGIRETPEPSYVLKTSALEASWPKVNTERALQLRDDYKVRIARPSQDLHQGHMVDAGVGSDGTDAAVTHLAADVDREPASYLPGWFFRGHVRPAGREVARLVSSRSTSGHDTTVDDGAAVKA